MLERLGEGNTVKFRMRMNRRGHTATLFGILATLTLSVSLLTPPTPAEAANAHDFNPGNIISDANFYNSDAMSAAEVQAFLNAKVPRCTIGDPGRGAGSVWGSTTIAYSCLKNFSMTTASIPANAYCGAYAGRAGETSAQIIAKVGKACGISQRVLLITLEKEQSLVTDSWPTVRQFDVATGYACPDSGPGGTANCNSAYFGFSTQVYYAAWQLKVYRAHIDSYRYKPFQVNTIQWHPNIGCGTSQVYIENWATASLYIYTPYRPNQAALDAGWGTGDACSTYGNRNFFLFYSEWFGDPSATPNPGQAAIDLKRAQNTWLGAPVTGYNSHSAQGLNGVVRGYENGVITWASTTGAKILSHQIRAYHRENSGLSGWMGWPTSESTTYGSGRWVQNFQGGSAALRPGFPVLGLNGTIRSTYVANGGFSGNLGWPVNESWVVNSRGDIVQGFDKAAITKSRYGTHTLTGDIRRVLNENGGLNGPLGWPVNTEWTVNDRGDSLQGFENGAITKSRYGTHTLTGDIRRVLNENGGLNGPLGWPVNTEWTVNDRGDSLQGFGKRRHHQVQVRHTHLTGDIRRVLNENGGLNGPLGWPVNTEWTVNDRGDSLKDSKTAPSPSPGTAHTLTGDIRRVLNENGGLNGPLGWPVNTGWTVNDRGDSLKDSKTAPSPSPGTAHTPSPATSDEYSTKTVASTAHSAGLSQMHFATPTVPARSPLRTEASHGTLSAAQLMSNSLPRRKTPIFLPRVRHQNLLQTMVRSESRTRKRLPRTVKPPTFHKEAAPLLIN